MDRLLLKTSILLLVCAAAAQGLQASERKCGNQSLNGVYGALATGDLFFPAPLPSGPTARAGRVVSDGNGNAGVKATISFNGAIFEEDYTGIYSVNPDCTLQVTLFIPFPGIPDPIPFTFFGVIADEGREVMITLLDPPLTTVRIGLRRQDKKHCANSDLSGGYLLNMAGENVFLPGAIPGPFSRVGKLDFDGTGGFKADTRVSYHGLIVPEVFAGSYSVDSSCNVTLAYTLGQSYTWVGTLTDNSQGAVLILSNPQGAVVSGTLKKQ